MASQAPYQTLAVGPHALDYLLKFLTNGKDLARFISARGDLADGTFKVLVPPDAEFEASSNLEWSIAPEPPIEQQQRLTGDDGSEWRVVPKPDMRQALVDEIDAYLAIGGDRVCVFEDIAAERGNRWLEDAETRLVYSEKRAVFHVLDTRDATTPKVIETVANAVDWLTIGCLGPAGDFPMTSDEVGEQSLKSLARAAEKTVMTAFDGDGWLVWTAPD